MKVNTCVTAVVPLVFTSFQNAAHAQEHLKQGAKVYRVCAACHSLKPGVHLSGPSLAGLWGKRNTSVAGFKRYSSALRQAEIVWDENTLNAWIAGPEAMVPGTTMTFRGIENDKARANLIAFLRRAMAKGGFDRVTKGGVIPEDLAEGQIPPDLSQVGPEQRITGIRHCGDAYHVATADGATVPLWEANVRLKIDTSARGPGWKGGVLIPSGMVGDRFSVVFPSLDGLVASLKERC